MLLLAETPPPASTSLPPWLAFPLLALSLLGMVGLFYSIRGVIRLFDPAENAFTIPASQTVFRFRLTQPGQYEIGCTRPSQFNAFTLPPVVLGVRPLPAGPEQQIAPLRWGYMKRTNLSGDTTVRFGSFRADAPGEYELRNPGAAQFRPGDQLRIIPDAGFKTVLFIFAIIASAFALIGGGIVGLIAAKGL